MESWSSLLSNLESDEIESIFLSTCDRRLNHPSQTTDPPSELPRHDSAISGLPAEKDTSIELLRPRWEEASTAHTETTIVYSKEKPSQNDFDNAVWVSMKQNGITQYWAPRYTTSPHYNTSESARILHMSSLKATANPHNAHKGCAAVDLSAGIGSFAFSYATAGVQKVLCWDANPWSIEGLRRGAVRDRWNIQVHHGDQAEEKAVKVHSKTRLVAFVESNDKAAARIHGLRQSLPPIRHVHCGVLPGSNSLLATAAAALDPRLGGWIHLQQTFRAEEVVCGANETRVDVETIVERLDRERGYLTDVKGTPRKPIVQHVQRVWSYRPGTFHCVVDIHIPPIRI
ncbi:unnamed protein product [Aureobasidium uvarum]|uniref:tRNA(Phe) (4-demethylwyosine(37)-C(7)) aminocarboxypropyltransferase n=1 Tax=Aureobasidium uvarum TaxID=2773716 RepID=A0A9N8PSZ3_9PEZI|nr:unnamed protein product [Aureobasidium uvarum]